MIIDLHPTEDQQMIADSIGGMLADALPVSRLREESGHAGAIERSLWNDLAEMGLFGMGIAEEDGGAGYGLPEEIVAARELGRVLASPSVLAQMAAVHLSEDNVREALIAGKERAAFAARGLGGEVLLFDGAGADHVVLLSDTAVLASCEMFDWQSAVSMDETLTIHRSPHTDPTEDTRSPIADRISLLLSAALSGMAHGATALAVEYASQREQFGQPIGSFQAIKHQLADMRVRADAADSQTMVAAVAFGRGNNDRNEVAAARWLAGDAAISNAKAGIQVHGGMGFTAECDAHLFLKRAHTFASLGSSRRAEERRLLDQQ
ncbi:acyl-CoA dehydrogenase family protein [Erythrobacter litoralis]|uniref:acyl-CoA dehydrogenase family protein n=1 Tax=Erythrobacter litoralis TaxID=39960 RepID=UPI002434D0D4|nr:acyl-CoA/acyl-ACP dehydrogenase [Erythrobacter litoralis]